MKGLSFCPAAYAGYQLLRQQALAEGFARPGRYDIVISALAIDERNEELQNCLRRTGLSSLDKWGDLFHGKARFAVFTHQQWVAWVKANDAEGNWQNWLSYVTDRYGLQGTG